jgi:WD40 repeat protein
MSRNQSYFVTGGADGNVILWGLETPNGTLKKLGEGTVEKGAITGVAYGTAAHEILVATSAGDISSWSWDRANSNPILARRSLDVHVIPSERGKASVTVSDDGRFIAAGSDYDDKARRNNRVWEVATGKSWPLEEGTRIVNLAFGNNYLVGGASENGVAQVWNGTTGSLLHTLGHDMGWLTSADFNWDSSRLGVTARDGRVRIFDVATQQDLLHLVGHESDVNTARFSPDGESVVTASGDRSVRVWDGETGEEIVRLSLDEEPLDAHFAFGSDYVITTLDDGIIKLLSTDWTKLRGQRLVRAVCKKKVELIETIINRRIAWQNRIESIFSQLFRQVDACPR